MTPLVDRASKMAEVPYGVKPCADPKCSEEKLDPCRIVNVKIAVSDGMMIFHQVTHRFVSASSLTPKKFSTKNSAIRPRKNKIPFGQVSTVTPCETVSMFPPAWPPTEVTTASASIAGTVIADSQYVQPMIQPVQPP